MKNQVHLWSEALGGGEFLGKATRVFQFNPSASSGKQADLEGESIGGFGFGLPAHCAGRQRRLVMVEAGGQLTA